MDNWETFLVSVRANMVTSRFLALGLILLSVGCGQFVNGCVVIINNNCPYEVTACSQSQAEDIVQYDLGGGGAVAIDLAASNCSWPGVVYASATGKCADELGNSMASDRNLANVAELSIKGVIGQDFYDLSNVNGYNIPLAIRPSNGSCFAVTCSISNIYSFCQPNNVLRTIDGGTLGLVCINTDGSAGLGPTNGTNQFKSACPEAYSHSFDDIIPSSNCPTGSKYEVVFCP